MVVGTLVVVGGAGLGTWLVTRGDDGSAVASGAPTSTGRTAPTTTTTLRDPNRGNGEPVTFAFGGDVHFEGALRGKLLADPSTLLSPAAPVLSAADVAVVNLETAITDGGQAVQPKLYNFRAPPVALDALRAAGVDAATVANNHGLDFGPLGWPTRSPRAPSIGSRSSGSATTPRRRSRPIGSRCAASESRCSA